MVHRNLHVIVKYFRRLQKRVSLYTVVSQNALDLFKSSIERNKIMNGLSKAIGK